MKKRLRIDLSLYTILQILSISLFERIPIYQALADNGYNTKKAPAYIQLELFNS
jgi:hypothetical protein